MVVGLYDMYSFQRDWQSNMEIWCVFIIKPLVKSVNCTITVVLWRRFITPMILCLLLSCGCYFNYSISSISLYGEHRFILDPFSRRVLRRVQDKDNSLSASALTLKVKDHS